MSCTRRARRSLSVNRATHADFLGRIFSGPISPNTDDLSFSDVCILLRSTHHCQRYMRTHTHTHTRARALTRTHTHTRSCVQDNLCSFTKASWPTIKALADHYQQLNASLEIRVHWFPLPYHHNAFFTAVSDAQHNILSCATPELDGYHACASPWLFCSVLCVACQCRVCVCLR
jgi:hypothetical protein